jgi:hypothetical protein
MCTWSLISPSRDRVDAGYAVKLWSASRRFWTVAILHEPYPQMQANNHKLAAGHPDRLVSSAFGNKLICFIPRLWRNTPLTPSAAVQICSAYASHRWLNSEQSLSHSTIIHSLSLLFLAITPTLQKPSGSACCAPATSSSSAYCAHSSTSASKGNHVCACGRGVKGRTCLASRRGLGAV